MLAEERQGAADRISQGNPRVSYGSLNGRAERPLPFVLRRCLSWLGDGDLPRAEDGELTYWRRAGLTGEVALTSQGRDVHFSDLEV